MILSSIVMPDHNGFPVRELCYRGDCPDVCALKRGDVLCFDTYFGSFSCEKWRKYTDIENLRLRVKARGLFKISLLDQTGKLSESSLDFADGLEHWIDIPGGARGILYFQAEALSDRAAFLGASYEGEPAAARDVRIALNICTYRREAYVSEIIRALNEGLKSCAGCVDAFVIDNGRTLDPGGFPRFVHLFPNENTGGSGGFARGMEEIIRAGLYTHMVMMDDDVRIHPESIERLYAFLQCLRPEYAENPVAGAMIRLDGTQTVQHEAGGVWREIRTDSIKANLALRKFANVVENEAEEPFDYAAWWFCCVPVAVAKRLGPPQPFFIRYDDVEYGLRIGLQPLTLNGICVWHQPFESKCDPALEYYSIRNGLAVNALHRTGFTAAKARRWVWRLYWGNIFRYRYMHFELILRGVEDYLNGSFYHADQAALHRSLSDMARSLYTKEERPQAADGTIAIKWDNALTKIIGALTLNGMIFPFRGEAVVPAYRNSVRSHYRKRRVYNAVEGTDQGYWLYGSRKRAWKLLVRCAKLLSKMK